MWQSKDAVVFMTNQLARIGLGAKIQGPPKKLELITSFGEVSVETQTLAFTLDKETKNTVRYQEDLSGKPTVVGTLYIQKWALGNTPPKNLTVTVQESES